MGNKHTLKGNLNSGFALMLIIGALIVSIILYVFVMGHPSHFDAKGDAIGGDYLGIVHEGGPVVPVLMAFFIIVLGVSVERSITTLHAYGKNSLSKFVESIKSKLAANDIEGAIAECDTQKGSVGNVTLEVLNRYKTVTGDNHLSKDKKLDALQKEVEEATMLELPALEKNLTIIATLASVSTLIALFGTVIGMIKAFAALATTGSPDPSALASGISEALINTALGIFTSAIAIVVYNFFTSKVDDLTHSIDEIGFAIRQHYISSGK